MEALPDALARAEAQLPPAQRPLGLDWTRFLGVMGLCLEGVYTGTGLLAPSAVAGLFEEKLDDKLEFLTRRRSRLPPPRKTVKEPAKSAKYGVFSGLGAAAAGAGAGAGLDGDLGKSEMKPSGSAGAAGAGGSLAAGSSGAEDASMREAGSSVDMGDDTLLESSFGGGSRRRDGTPATTHGANDQDGGASRLVGADGGLHGRRGGGRGGGTAALKSLLRPQARHEVLKDYGEAVSKRRERQREALRRAPEPDVEPTRAYKPCGLCQAPFPVESLGSTVSLKVLGTFLAKAGAPSERFDRKASRLCALHRLPLCVFCSQFFDPDFPGGIVPPGGYTERLEGGGGGGGRGGGRRKRRRSRGGRTSGGVSLWFSKSSLKSSSLSASSSRASPAPVEANCLVPFFDDRFPDRFSDTPPPSSAPAAHVHSPPTPLSKMGKQEGHGAVFSSGPKRDSVGGGMGSCGGKGGTHHVRQAMELREIGGLVRRGCSIRDRLTMLP